MTSTSLLRCALATALGLAVFGCGRKGEATLLTYVPADTAYVYANLEPMPKAVSNAWLAKMGPLLAQYELMLARLDGDSLARLAAPKATGTDATDTGGDDEDDANPVTVPAKPLPPEAAVALRVARELMKEWRGINSVEKLAEIGLNSQAHGALYGIGIWPVARTELGSVDAFRAFIARIEQNSDAKLSIGKVGQQDYWFIPAGKVDVVLAIQDKQLVVTVFPAKADDALKQRLLGLVKPEKNLAGSGDLASLIKAEGYIPQGAGWIDLRRILAQYAADPTLAALVASMGGTKLPELSAECRGELDGIVAKAPRMIAGYTALSATQMDSRGRIELEPALAADMLALTPAPVAAGGRHPDALFDLYASIPVLKVKDFALKQAKAIVAAPYRCESLKGLNELAAESIEKLSQMLPPPFSDITGLRITIDSLVMPAGESMVPDVRGKLLIATENPSFLVGLAQMGVPSLASLVIKPDRQPVELPTKDLPMGTELPPVHVAMADKALAFSFGKDESASLADYVGAPAGKTGDWVTSSYSSEVYRLQADLMKRLQAALPADSKSPLDPALTGEINRLYADIFKRFDMDLRTSSKGIEFDQKVELKP